MGARFGRAFPPSSVLRQAEIPLGNTYVPYTTPGLYNYHIPSWVQAGHLIDIVLIGGGTGGQYFASVNGNGGLAAAWNAQTFTYGVDIPNGTTDLAVFVGSGAIPQTAGSASRVGYGLGSSPAFGSVGSYMHGASAASVSTTFTSTAGQMVLAAVTWTGTLNTAAASTSLGGVGPSALFQRASSASGFLNGFLAWFNVAGGVSQTLQIGSSSTFGVIGAIPISYSNAANFFVIQNGTGDSGTALSLSTRCTPNCLTLQMFGGGNSTDTLSAFSGGNPRANGTSAGVSSVSVSDTTTDATTFTATGSASTAWGALALTLVPSMSTTLITGAGGAALNTTTTGTGPGNDTFPASGLASKTYIGGAAQATLGANGNTPGGGGAGGTSSLVPGNGGDGAVFITARRS